MEIIESFLKGKRPDARLCEDGWVVTPHFAAVVDGSTSKVAGRHGGRVAMEAVCHALQTLRPDVPKAEMLRVLTASLAVNLTPQARSAAEYRTTCSAVIFSAARRVVWMVGDCQCRFGGHTFTHPKLVDEVLVRARVEAATYLLAHGYTAQQLQENDLARACIFDAIRQQTNFQNDTNPYNPYRYPVLDGTCVDPQLVPELEVPADVTEVVLASDGYPRLFDSLADCEAELRRLLHADPLCIGPNAASKCLQPGNDSFDDRCYLRLHIGSAQV